MAHRRPENVFGSTCRHGCDSTPILVRVFWPYPIFVPVASRRSVLRTNDTRGITVGGEPNRNTFSDEPDGRRTDRVVPAVVRRWNVRAGNDNRNARRRPSVLRIVIVFRTTTTKNHNKDPDRPSSVSLIFFSHRTPRTREFSSLLLFFFMLIPETHDREAGTCMVHTHTHTDIHTIGIVVFVPCKHIFIYIILCSGLFCGESYRWTVSGRGGRHDRHGTTNDGGEKCARVNHITRTLYPYTHIYILCIHT